MSHVNTAEQATGVAGGGVKLVQNGITAWRMVRSPLGSLYVKARPEGVFSVGWDQVRVEEERAQRLTGRGGRSGGDRRDGCGSGDGGVQADAAGQERVRTDEQAETAAASPADRELSRLAAQWADQAAAELTEYFQGRRKSFDVPVTLFGTPFQVAVWGALRQIPYGQTQSYGDIAAAIGRPRAVRAVGQANRANPVAVMVPCHRVIGANGALVGYAGQQVDLKEQLLDLEQAWV